MRFLSWLWSLFGGPVAPEPEFITKVQAQTVKYCGFLPAASTVANIVGAATGQSAAIATVTGIATTICRVVGHSNYQKVYGLVGQDKPTIEIEGQQIVIEGEFVTK